MIEAGKALFLVADAADKFEAMDKFATAAVSKFTDTLVKQTLAVADLEVQFMKTTGVSAEFANL